MALVVLAANAILFLAAWEVMALSGVPPRPDRARASRRRSGPRSSTSSPPTSAPGALRALRAARQRGRLLRVRGTIAHAGCRPAAPGALRARARRLRHQGRPHAAPRLAPRAHAAAPSHVSALMSGVLHQDGIYGLLRVPRFFDAPPRVVGRGCCSRPGVRLGACSASPSRSASTTSSACSPTTASRTSASSPLGIGLALLGRLAAEPALRRCSGFAGGAAPRREPRRCSRRSCSSAPGASCTRPARRDIDRLGGLAQRDAAGPPLCSWSARSPSAASRRSTASSASGSSTWARSATARAAGDRRSRLGGAAAPGARARRRPRRGLLRQGRSASSSSARPRSEHAAARARVRAADARADGACSPRPAPSSASSRRLLAGADAGAPRGLGRPARRRARPRRPAPRPRSALAVSLGALALLAAAGRARACWRRRAAARRPAAPTWGCGYARPTAAHAVHRLLVRGDARRCASAGPSFREAAACRRAAALPAPTPPSARTSPTPSSTWPCSRVLRSAAGVAERVRRAPPWPGAGARAPASSRHPDRPSSLWRFLVVSP